MTLQVIWLMPLTILAAEPPVSYIRDAETVRAGKYTSPTYNVQRLYAMPAPYRAESSVHAHDVTVKTGTCRPVAAREKYFVHGFKIDIIDKHTDMSLNIGTRPICYIFQIS
jgi:hypothetical protein